MFKYSEIRYDVLSFGLDVCLRIIAVGQHIIVSLHRESYLFKCEWFLGRCRMGNACCSYMSALPESDSWRYCQSIFYHHVSMVSARRTHNGVASDFETQDMATASATKTN
jgi:hypothetical protein